MKNYINVFFYFTLNFYILRVDAISSNDRSSLRSAQKTDDFYCHG